MDIRSPSLRPPVIYTKQKDVTITLTPDLRLQVDTRHIDLRHHMELAVRFTQPQLIIEDLSCKMNRYPHDDCIHAREALNPMIGQRMQPGIMRQAYRSVGRNGCTHLTSLFQEACYAVIQGLGIYRREDLQRMVPGLSSEQTEKIMFDLRPENIDSCTALKAEGPFVTAAREARLPRQRAIQDFLDKHRPLNPQAIQGRKRHHGR